MILTVNRKLSIPESHDLADIVAALESSMRILDQWENPANIPYTNAYNESITNVKSALDIVFTQLTSLANSIATSTKAIRDELTAGTLKPKNASYADSAGSANAVAWAKVTGKPTTFAPATHSHAWSAITDKPTTFAPSAHNHSAANITSGTLAVARGGTGVTTIQALRNNLGCITVGAAPAASENFKAYVNSSNKVLYYWNGSAWVASVGVWG